MPGKAALKGAKKNHPRVRLDESLVETQKLQALGSLAGGIAHDFNNLLGVILGVASLLRLRLPPADPLQELVRMIEESAERAADLTRQLLGFVRPGTERSKPACVQVVLQRLVKIIRETFDRRIQVCTDWVPELLWVEAEPGLLEQAVLNLCLNARDAMREGGTLAIEISKAMVGKEDARRPAHCPPGHYVRIAVRDTGPGIAPEILPHIFEPFFTTKPRGKGTGLGLTVVAGFVNRHGGFLDVETAPGAGAQFRLCLPAALQPEREPARSSPPKLVRGTGTVLVVDDEPLILAFVEEGLSRLGYKVLRAESGQRALEIYALRPQEIACVLLDVVMTEISGLETCRRLRRIDPHARVILSSGFGSPQLLREARDAGATDFIAKPYMLEELSVKLRKGTCR